MDKISTKIKQQSYESLDEVAADFMLMFENACKYNEPDSQIYKDALILQQLVIQKKQELRYISKLNQFIPKINFLPCLPQRWQRRLPT